MLYFSTYRAQTNISSERIAATKQYETKLEKLKKKRRYMHACIYIYVICIAACLQLCHSLNFFYICDTYKTDNYHEDERIKLELKKKSSYILYLMFFYYFVSTLRIQYNVMVAYNNKYIIVH